MMDGSGDGTQAERDGLALTLGAIAALAGVGACLATGGLSILAGALAVSCLAGSVVARASTPETSFEEYCRQCDAETAAPEAIVVTPGPEAGQAHSWRQSVALGRQASRGR